MEASEPPQLWDDLAVSQTARARNDLRQYDDLVDQWWPPRGAFAMLHWIARSRVSMIPKAARSDAVLVDVGTGAGLLAPYVQALGYRHVGLDLVSSALQQAQAHNVIALRADVRVVPLRDACADVVVAGEILEHVAPMSAVVAEACRVLRPGGTLVIDTIADTFLARLIAVELAERLPGGAPKGIHDPSLFVSRKELVAACASHGVAIRLNGLRPSVSSLAAFLLKRRDDARMVRTFSTAVLFQGVGEKRR